MGLVTFLFHGDGTILQSRIWLVGVRGFSFETRLVAVVRVIAADESTARNAVPSVLSAPGLTEIKLANEANALLGGAIVTSVDFRVEGSPVRVA